MPSSSKAADFAGGTSSRDPKRRTDDHISASRGDVDGYKSSKTDRMMPPPADLDRKGDYSSTRSDNTSRENRHTTSRGYDNGNERQVYSDRSRGDDARSKPSSGSRTDTERKRGRSRSPRDAGNRYNRNDSPPNSPSVDEARMETDGRSIYVGNVDYSAVAEDLERHFNRCGNIIRVTIPNDKATGRSRGYAYIEFAERHAVNTALGLDQSNFRGRRMKVSAKRTNKPYAVSGVYGRTHGLESSGNGGGKQERPSYRREYGGNGEPRRYSPGHSGRERFAPYEQPQRRNTSRYS